MPIYLKIDGIDGDVTVKGREKWIEVLSFSWGMTNTGAGAHGGGGGAGKVVMQDFHFVHNVDKASPKLLGAVCDGRHFQSATLAVADSGDPSGGDANRDSDFLLAKMEDVLISGVRPGGNAATDDRPMEEVSFNFAKISAHYRALDGEVVEGSCG